MENVEGDLSIGSAFHVGDGVFVTARHCVEGMRIREVKITEPIPVSSREFLPGFPDDYYENWDKAVGEILGTMPMYKHFLSPLVVDGEPFFHEKPDVDLAAFRVNGLHSSVPFVKLGMHWDDWIYRRSWTLTSAIVLGYPPIPMTSEPTLVAAKGDILTFVVPRHSSYIHFVLSSTARGGFSGGPAIHEDGYALGLVTSSFVRNDLPSELGFQAILSIEPIRLFLESTSLMPAVQLQYSDELVGRKKPPR